MFQLGKTDGVNVIWDEDLIFKSLSGASVAVRNLFLINGSVYSIKQVGGF